MIPACAVDFGPSTFLAGAARREVVVPETFLRRALLASLVRRVPLFLVHEEELVGNPRQHGKHDVAAYIVHGFLLRDCGSELTKFTIL